MKTITVNIDNVMPATMEINADTFGKFFSEMDSEDQVDVLRAMVSHMRRWPTQWDYIGIKLDEPENADIKRTLKGMFEE